MHFHTIARSECKDGLQFSVIVGIERGFNARTIKPGGEGVAFHILLNFGREVRGGGRIARSAFMVFYGRRDGDSRILKGAYMFLKRFCFILEAFHSDVVKVPFQRPIASIV